MHGGCSAQIPTVSLGGVRSRGFVFGMKDQGLWCGFVVGGLGFRGGLVFKAHRLPYHSKLGSRVIKKKRRRVEGVRVTRKQGARTLGFERCWDGWYALSPAGRS